MTPTQKTARLQELLSGKNFGEAKKLADELVKDNPRDFNAKFVGAQLLLQAGEAEGAATQMLDILRHSPKAVKVVELLCAAFVKSGLLGPAIACQSRLIHLNPTDLRHHRDKAALYEALVRQKNEKYDPATRRAVEGVDFNHFPQKVVILCGGASGRWGGYLGVRHKQLIPVMGEVLLERTIRQVRRHSQCEVDVLVPPGGGGDFSGAARGEGVSVKAITPPPGLGETPASKYLASCAHWSEAGPTVVLLGDVWFSDAAVQTIFAPKLSGWQGFGRFRPSSHTGYPYGNFFGIRVEDGGRHRKSLELLDRLYRAHICTAHGGGWAWSQLTRGDDPNVRSPGENFIEIDDFTDDFDHPADYDRWMQAVARRGQGVA